MTEADFRTQPGAADLMLGALLAMAPDEQVRLLQDADRAAPWLKAAAEAGLAPAQLRHGRWLLERGQHEAALALFLRAARHGDIDAQNMVGRCLENGWGVKPDPRRAARWFARAARAGHAWAQYNLGHLCLDGLGVPRDPAAAYGWYLEAARQGHVRAMNLVARCLEEGWGVSSDRTAARKWLRRSAEGGYFRGQYNYATVLAAEARLDQAAELFAAAMAGAPELTQRRMAEALAARPEPTLNRLGRDVLGGARPCS